MAHIKFVIKKKLIVSNFFCSLRIEGGYFVIVWFFRLQ